LGDSVTQTVDQFISVLETMGSIVTYHRESGGDVCPCRTPEGFRDPAWHRDNPLEPVCNEQGYINPDVVSFTVQAAVQPVLARSFRRPSEREEELLGDIQADDHLGIFPYQWGGNTLNFDNWSESGSDYIIYDGHRYTVISFDLIPDIDGDPHHHFEVGLRRMKNERPNG
jgi:hypothetical protein